MVESLLLKIPQTERWQLFKPPEIVAGFVKSHTLPCVHSVLLAFENKNTSTGDTHCSIRAGNPTPEAQKPQKTPTTNTQQNTGGPAALKSNYSCWKASGWWNVSKERNPSTNRDTAGDGQCAVPSLKLSLNNLSDFLLDKSKPTCQRCWSYFRLNERDWDGKGTHHTL